MARVALTADRMRRGPAIVGLGALACALLAACGGNTPSAPTTPVATPSTPVPSPEPANAGFLHVLQGSSIVTYAIDAATGQLQQSVTQRVGEAHTLTGEPQARFVFAAYNGRGFPPQDASIVSYAPDPSSGSLTTLSEATVSYSRYWYWLSASSMRVYGMMFYSTPGHTYPSLVSHAVGSDGQLGPASTRSLEQDTKPSVAVDVDSDPNVFYKSTSTREFGEIGGVTAHFVEPDGGLKQMGGSNLCLASSTEHVRPLMAARGFLFASAQLTAARPFGPSTETVCSWEGPRLAPRANLGLMSDLAVALAPRATASSSSATSAATLVAIVVGSEWGEHHEVRLFAMRDDGDLTPLDAVTGPWSAKHLLFHPSGRFLYVSYAAYYEDRPVGLTVYSIDPQGHLELVQTLEDGGGTMAVTRPPQVRPSAGAP